MIQYIPTQNNFEGMKNATNFQPMIRSNGPNVSIIQTSQGSYGGLEMLEKYSKANCMENIVNNESNQAIETLVTE